MKKVPVLKEFAALVRDAKWRKVQVVEKKQQVFFDQDSSKPWTLTLTGCFPLFVSPGFLLVAYKMYDYPEIGHIVSAAAALVGTVMLLAGVGFLYLANKPGDRYLLDFSSAELIEFRKKKSEVIHSTLCSFEDLDTLVVYPRYSFKNDSKGWYFGLSLATKAGSLLHLVSRKSNRDRQKAIELGTALADLLKITFLQGEKDSNLEYKQTSDGLEFSYTPFKPN